MQIARYETNGAVHYGVLEEDTLKRLADSPFDSLEVLEITDKLADVTLLAPVEAPRIFGVGLNYVLHIREMKAPEPKIPLFFMKPSSTVVGPGAPIVYPREGTNVHFEGEVAVVIGRTGRRIARDDALDHVLGYTCANDVSDRTIQRQEMASGALLMGKGFDTFCPIGPVVATALDSSDLELSTRVNGDERQASSTSDLLFGVPELIAYLSSAVTLHPGDIIMTGTPSGVGPIVPGDTIEVSVAGVGTLSNSVIAEDKS